eukprot:TRINITY_DN105205_c0_g1_i1.p1 TRINITY_DN105205_c0_g1~~TRINITY_DN105205_c0_g1_i1.p1  ORF type:complete len:795 (+),score=149.55 TRINITY_DN105205_c0_g1_i1:40-2424(+)
MISTLRNRASPRHAARFLRRLPIEPKQAGVPRFCSGGDKKPAKGFEKFYRAAESSKKSSPKAEAESKTEKAEASAEQKGPKETSRKQETPSKEGKGPENKSSDKKASSDKKPSDKDTLHGQRVQTLGLLAGMGAFSLYMYLTSETEVQDEVTIQDMIREYLVKGYVEKIQIVNREFCRVHLLPDAPGGAHMVTIRLGRLEAFEDKLERVQADLGIAPADHIPIQYIHETSWTAELLPYLPSLLFLIPMMMFARSMSGGMGGPGGMGGRGGGRNMFTMGKAFPGGQKDVKSKVKFADVAGLEQAKTEVVEFVDFLKNPTKYEQLGARTPKGGLFVGPPGTGKTLLAKAVAGEADVPFYSMSGSDFVEMYVGVGPSRVRDLFKQARDSAPSIIFIDEIDAVGRKRGKGGMSGGGNDERENTLNQMLVEMDGFSSGTGVVVLAGTNRADVLDEALLRPGRFDRQIAIDRPDISEREKIFMVHLKPVTLDEKLDPADVAKRMAALTPGFAGADIANICNEAAIFAARRKAEAVEMDDFERATERVLGGLPKTNNLMSPAEKRTVAIHESGHAVAGWMLENADPLLKVSIQPRSSGALGFAQYLPAEMSLHSKETILDKIAVALGGRAAEELFVGRISTGASDDLDKVTKMAHAMVAVYGMCPEVGLLSYGQNDASQQFYKPYSEGTAQLIDSETRAIVDSQYARVKDLLTEHKDKLLALTDKLDEKETLVYQDLVGVLGERPWALKEEYSKFVTAGGSGSKQDSEQATTKEATAGENSASHGAEEASKESQAPAAAAA